MQSKQIPDEDIGYSSVVRNGFGLKYDRSRLHDTTSPGSWTADPKDVAPWLQVDFHYKMLITGVATQGRHISFVSQWMTSYTVSYSRDGKYFILSNMAKVRNLSFLNVIEFLKHAFVVSVAKCQFPPFLFVRNSFWC